jgi:hypothetical protein
MAALGKGGHERESRRRDVSAKCRIGTFAFLTRLIGRLACMCRRHGGRWRQRKCIPTGKTA